MASCYIWIPFSHKPRADFSLLKVVSQWIPTWLWWCTVPSQTQLPVFYPQFTSPVQHEQHQAPERPWKAPAFEIFIPDSLWATLTSLQFEIRPVWLHNLTECSSVLTEACTAPAANTWLGTCLQQVSDGAHGGSPSTKTLTANPAPRVLAILAGATGSPRYNNLLPSLGCLYSPWQAAVHPTAHHKQTFYLLCRTQKRSFVVNLPLFLLQMSWKVRMGLVYLVSTSSSVKRHQPCSPCPSTTGSASEALEKVPAPTDTGRGVITDFLVHLVTWPRQSFTELLQDVHFLSFVTGAIKTSYRGFSFDAIICPQGTHLKFCPRPKTVPSTVARFNPKPKNFLWHNLGAGSPCCLPHPPPPPAVSPLLFL